MDPLTKDWIDTVLNWINTSLVTVQTLILAGSALWAYFRFFREGVHQPRIEFDIECSFFGPQQNQYVAAFTIHAINRGNVQYTF